jgi:hypothetical protein
MPTTRRARATSTTARTSAKPGPAVVKPTPAKRAEIEAALVAAISGESHPTAADLAGIEGPADRPDTVAPIAEPEAVVIDVDLSDAPTATPVESHEDTTSTEEVKKETDVAKPALAAVPDAKPAKVVTGLVAGRLENQDLVGAAFLANWASTRPVVHVKGTACTLPKNVTEKARKEVLPLFVAEQAIAKAKGKRTTLFCIRCTVKAKAAAKAAAPAK